MEKNENKIFLFFIRIMVERKKGIIGISVLSLTKKCLSEKIPLLEDITNITTITNIRRFLRIIQILVFVQ